MRRTALILVMIGFITGIVQGQDTMIGPDDYPDDVNPLTGQQVDDESTLERRPLIVKIINAPADVRPQAGVMAADIVWEHLLAGGITRFSAVYLSEEPEHVGPIRSARLVDFELVRIYRALFTYSGMAEGTIDILRGDPLMGTRLVGGTGPCPPLCRFPDEGDKLEWTLFADVAGLRELAVDLERNTEPEPVYGMAFSETTPENGVTVEGVTIAYRQTDVHWQWDSATGEWLREQDGTPHRDRAANEQIHATNVMIIEEEHTEQPFVHEGYWGPPNYAFSVNFIGTGRAVLLRDGQYIEGEWRRERREDPLTFYDADGEVLPFKPGNTFFELVPRWPEGYQLTFALRTPEMATVSTGSANLRYGPGTGYPVGGAAYRGDVLTAIGRNNTGSWVQVQFDDDVLWAARLVVDISDEAVARLPLARPTVED